MFHRMKFLGSSIDYMARKLKELSPLGKWIKAILDEQGKNQAWLATKIHVQPPQVSRIMSGESDTSLSTLNAIADALGKRRSEVYRVAGHFEPITTQDDQAEQILYETHDLTQIEKEEILAFIRMKKNLRKRNGHK